MKSAKKHFEQNIERVKNLGNIYKTINLQTTRVLDLSDILRAQYVLLVSALDHFVHEIVRLGMIEIYNEKRKVTKEFKAFILSIDKDVLFKKAIMEQKDDIWLDYQIRHKNGFKSFQQADKLKEAMLLIIDTDIWEQVAQILNEDIKSLKNRLNLIIDRRNQIAHEADIEPTYQELRDIHIDDINDSIKYIENLVTTIFEICK